MTSSTTPQDRAVELIRKFIVTNVGYDAGHLMTVQAQELTILLGDAGLLSSGTPQEEDGSRSKPPADGEGYPDALVDRVRQVLHNNNLGCAGQPGKHDKVAREVLAALDTPTHPPKASVEDALVDVVAEMLRERPFRFGPNTRDSITRGMEKVWLTGNERRDLARMALEAVAETQKERT